MKKIFLFLLLLCSLSVQSFSQNAEYRQAVKDMLEVSNSLSNFKMVIEMTMDNFKELYPEIESTFWDEFEGEFIFPLNHP